MWNGLSLSHVGCIMIIIIRHPLRIIIAGTSWNCTGVYLTLMASYMDVMIFALDLEYFAEITIGTSGQCSSQWTFGRSAFEQSTGNNVSGHHKWHYFLFFSIV